MTTAAVSPVARLARLAGVLPDALTALACLVVWAAPFALGLDAVKTVVLMVLMEFLLVHGTGFYTVIAFSDGMRKARRLALMGGLLCFYGLFLAALCISFEAWWPVPVFLWLMLSKAAWIFLTPHDSQEERERQMMAWGFSVFAYLAAVFAALILPLPRLGLDAAVVPRLDLPGSGEWVDRPHTAVAAMAMYFAALAWFKWFMERPRRNG